MADVNMVAEDVDKIKEIVANLEAENDELRQTVIDIQEKIASEAADDLKAIDDASQKLAEFEKQIAEEDAQRAVDAA